MAIQGHPSGPYLHSDQARPADGQGQPSGPYLHSDQARPADGQGQPSGPFVYTNEAQPSGPFVYTNEAQPSGPIVYANQASAETGQVGETRQSGGGGAPTPKKAWLPNVGGLPRSKLPQRPAQKEGKGGLGALIKKGWGGLVKGVSGLFTRLKNHLADRFMKDPLLVQNLHPNENQPGQDKSLDELQSPVKQLVEEVRDVEVAPGQFEKQKVLQEKTAYIPTRVTHYAGETEREHYRTKIKGGKLYREGQPLDTTTASQSNLRGSQQGRNMVVMGKDGRLYSADQVKEMEKRPGERAHHTTMLAGQDVAGAGEMQVREGQLEWLTDKSGHYQPPFAVTHQMFRAMKAQGLDVSKATVELGEKSKLGMPKKVLLNANEMSAYRDDAIKAQASGDLTAPERQIRALHAKKDNMLFDLLGGLSPAVMRENNPNAEAEDQQRLSRGREILRLARLKQGRGTSEDLAAAQADEAARATPSSTGTIQEDQEHSGDFYTSNGTTQEDQEHSRDLYN